MSGFTKLDEGILQSSVMAAPPVTFKVWIALLAACRSDGVARVSPTYLAAVCRLSLSDIGRALEELASPDPHSRTTMEEGRRIARVDGGWRLINYFKYRNTGMKEASSAARMARRKKAESGPFVGRVGYVYFARSADRIKIGFSSNPWARIAELKPAAPDISLIGTFRGTQGDERALHDRFASLSTGGGWFRSDDDLEREIVVRTTVVRSPDYSASASVSEEERTEGGVGGDGEGGAFYRPAMLATPSEQAAATRAWDRVSEALRSRVAPHTWATWLRPCRGLWLRAGRLQLEVPGAQHLDWIGRTWSAELQWAAAQAGLEGVDLVMPPARAAGE